MSLKRNITKMLVGIMIVNTAFANVGLTTFAKDLNAVQSESGQEQAIYVETYGNDLTGDGTKEKPFATVQRAKEKVRAMNDNMTGDITVYIGEGDYYLDETIAFGVEDSGSNGYNIIYKSTDGPGKARLVGGQPITGWQKCESSDVDVDLDPAIMDKVYKVKLDPEAYDFNTMYENGDRAIMARTRNYEYDSRFPSYHGEYMWSAGGDCHSLVYKEGDIDQKSIDGLINAQARGDLDAQVYVWDGGDWDWFTDTIPINSIDTSTRTLRFKQDPNRPELYRAKYPVGHGARYYLQGNLAFLDVPGEYYYNKTTGWLYYYPEEEDGAIESQEIIAPKMQQILYLKGEDKADLKDEPNPEKQVHHIVFSGLKIEGTEFDDYFTSGWNYSDAGGGMWVHPPEAKGSTLPSNCEQTDRPEYQVGAITLTDTNNITIEACQITNTGLYGVAMYLDNQYNTIKDSSIEHTGYGGISMDGGYPGIGKYNNNHTITNTEIHDVGEQVGHGTGITLMSSGSNNISNCEIFNSPRRAIMMSGWIQRDGSDAQYDPMKDMYTVQNRISNMYIHDCEQDSGEDSAVFNICLLRGEILRRLYGTNDPGEGKYNYYDQILIDNIGAHPSMLDKNTVHGLDLTMGGSGTHMSNIKVTNPQSRTMRIEPTVCDEVFYMDNMNNNYYNDDILNEFDDSRIDYDNIGLTKDFPFERYTKETKEHDDVYFSDDFESGELDLAKWRIEKGEPAIDSVYMSEGTLNGKFSLATDGDKNKHTGVVVGRPFESDLNKIVEVKYFDKRQDYARSDAGEGGNRYDITPNSFVRVDNGEIESQVAIGADGDKSKDYYFYKDGNEMIKTNVKRSFGWHSFKFDYSNAGKVGLYIDDTFVTELERESFNYLAMGDWNGQGGKVYFDEVTIYSGEYAPPVEELPEPPATPAPVPLERDLFAENFEDKVEVDDSWEYSEANNGAVKQAIVADSENSENQVWSIEAPDNRIVTNVSNGEWSNYTFECKFKIDGWGGSLEGPKPWDNAGISIYQTNPKGNEDPSGLRTLTRYVLRYVRESEKLELYKRDGGDSILASVPAPEGFEGKWHDIKMHISEGMITVSIDGQQVFNHKDNSLTSGGIGFDGINAKFSVDDIVVTRDATEVPSVNRESGKYDTPIEVVLTGQEKGDNIYYTTDGSDPTTSGVQYRKPLTIDKTTQLKAVAMKEGHCYSEVITMDYIIEGTTCAGMVLSGADQVKGEENLDVQIGLAGLEDRIYAEDITLQYDPEIFSLETITASGKTEVAGIKRDDVNGMVTILTGSPDGVIGSVDLLNVTFKAKDTESNKVSAITAVGKLGAVDNHISSIVEVDVATHNVEVKAGHTEEVDKEALRAAIQNAEQLYAVSEEGTKPGQYPEGSKAKLMSAIETAKDAMNNATTQSEVDQALTELNKAVQEFIDSKIPESVISGDINQDEKIDVADLALVAYHYAAKEGDVNWEQAKVADVAKDGKIDIEDLSFVANEILEK